jgi:hypothetical protein
VKPWLPGVNARTCALLACAVAHVTLFALPLAYGLAGLALLLVPSYGVVSPGLAQPPLCGEGERDRDMSLAPTDTGVPGMAERMRSTPLPNLPEVVPKSVVMIFGVLVAEERRRCWEESICGSDGESRLGNG